MWIVRVALKRPYTFVVLALLILMIGPITILRTPTDIFPNINIPILSVIWNFQGLSAEEMANRIVSSFERVLTISVNDIEHIESQSLNGVGVVKIFFQPGVRIDMAMAQVTAGAQGVLRQLPQGINPPFVVSYNASSVPILQLALSGPGLSEQQLFDAANVTLRNQLATVQGASIPFPYGGKQRQVQVDLNPSALQAKGLSPLDVVNAINTQNLILPAGTSKIGSAEYDVDINASPKTIAELNDLPIKTVGTTPIYIHDVAHVRDGFPPQTNIVRVNGQRATLMTILKTGNSSTLDIIQRVKDVLPRVIPMLPNGLDIRPLLDQSLFVRASIQGVLREAVIAACLTALMILIFLGSWRSTVIIAVSIPLSILSSIIALSALGETINIMTLGGLALAVGILVDDATVAIENINTQLEQGKDLEPAILDGAQQIAVPAFVSTLCICIVFVPMFFLSGVARYLFVPMAEAVVFAMLASYALSRTLVPTMAKYLLKAHGDEHETIPARRRNPFVAMQKSFDSGFNRVRLAYRRRLEWCVRHRRLVTIGFLAGTLVSFGLLPWVGEDFFPAVDTGQFKLHLRAPTGTRIEETATLTDHVEQTIRGVIPARELTTIVDNVGLPYSGLNLSYSNSAPIGAADADVLVSLSPDHAPTAGYIHDLRRRLTTEFPGVLFSFIPADIVSQILSFGLPAPLDVQIVGTNLEQNRQFAAALAERLVQVPGVVDLRVHQAFNQPKLHLDVDRTRASAAGFTQKDIASNLLISLSGSSQTQPTFWLNPVNGVSYSIATQMPQYRLNSLQDLGNIPVTGPSGARPQVMEGLVEFRRGMGMAVVSHYNTQPVIDIFGSVQNRDLGGVAREIQPILDSSRKSLPRGSQMIVRGVIETMTSSFIGLLGGLALAIVLVYFLIVVNFQSWMDPFIIISALPVALAGIVWMMFLSHTTFSVPALTGAIMCMGVATANSILVVSFAKDRMAEGRPPLESAIDAGFTRFRPVLMTASAMIIGMVPMAIGLGEGGEQNAPLGRAVIGGLGLATVATLFFVPALFTVLHTRQQRAAAAAGAARSARPLSGRSDRGSMRQSTIVMIAFVVLVCAITWWGIASRAKAMSILTHETHEMAVPTVAVVRPVRGTPTNEVILPGSIQAFLDAPIYARTSGYLKRRTVDIGAHVRTGQLLAEIDAPELQQQLEQARADLSVAEANQRLAKITAARYEDLAKSDAVSQQDVDNAKGGLEARIAGVESARHNVQRLEQLEAFTKIYAPFDGTITARNTDVGALIDSGASGGAARELFHIAATDRLRVFVNLPETYAREAKAGMSADLTLAEYPGRRFSGNLVRTTDAIDPTTRTMLVEIEVNNKSGELLPGSYAEVHMKLPSSATTFVLPVTSVLFRADGLRVGVVRDGNRVSLAPVTLGRDFGTDVEVLSGLTGSELIVANPSDSLAQDEVVRVIGEKD